MPKRKGIEIFKSALIVVLSLLAILLLYFLWGKGNLGLQPLKWITSGFPGHHEEIIVPKTESVIRPGRMVLRQEGDVYAVIEDPDESRWLEWRQGILQLAGDDGLTMEEISEAKFQEVCTYNYFEIDFDYPVKFSEFCSENQIKNPSIISLIDADSFVYSAGSTDSLLIADRRSGRYFRLSSPSTPEIFGPLFDSVRSEAGEPYYTLASLTGVPNFTLTPLELTKTSREYIVTPRLDPSDDETRVPFAEKFFGQNFDFIRTIEESRGNVIYMYGYGDKILNIYKDGRIEYRETFDNTASDSLGFYDSLRKVLEFGANHGGWYSESGVQMQPVLVRTQELESGKNKGYQFCFDMCIDGERIHSDNNVWACAEIYGSQVTSYTTLPMRGIVETGSLAGADYDGTDETAEFQTRAASIPETAAITPVNIIAASYEEMGKAQGIAEATFENVVSKVTMADFGYNLKWSEDAGVWRIEPVWIVRLDETEYYYGLV